MDFLSRNSLGRRGIDPPGDARLYWRARLRQVPAAGEARIAGKGGESMKRPHFATLWMLVGAALLGASCETPPSGQPTTEGELAAYVELVLPARIEIQRFLTKPVSFAGDGNADGLEVILAAYDAAGDLTKVVGTFHFELQTRRLSDRIGTRVAFWPVEINSNKAMILYRDPLSRFYDFPLELDHKPLPAGQYVLTAWLQLPTGRRLVDEYEFNYDGSGAAPLRS